MYAETTRRLFSRFAPCRKGFPLLFLIVCVGTALPIGAFVMGRDIGMDKNKIKNMPLYYCKYKIKSYLCTAFMKKVYR